MLHDPEGTNDMSETALSTTALILSIVPVAVHGVEVMFPLLARWIVNGVLPFFGFSLPSRATSLTAGEQMTMLDAAVEAAPAEKKNAAKDYIFLMLFEERQGAICFAAVATGAVYGITLALGDRHPLHLVFGTIAVLMALANANHAGVPFLGNHPRVSRHGRHVGIVFAPFWALVAALNVSAFATTLP